MKTNTHYAWEITDRSMVFVEHAYNRLVNFIRDGDDQELRAFRRAILDGSMFSAQDITATSRLLRTLASRARLNNTHRPPEVQDSIEQAASNGERVATELARTFEQYQAQNQDIPF